MSTHQLQTQTLRQLSIEYPSRQSVSNEIASLNAELDSPRGTEYFISDIHGEYEAFCPVLKDCVDSLARLHIIGDIYDRGPGAHLILDALTDYPSVDIQWGNHDIVWMGAAAGSEACSANVVRMCLRYANLESLEHFYGVSLQGLELLALEMYAEDDCQSFLPKKKEAKPSTERTLELMAKMHKAITIIQFKLESQIINRRPQYNMKERLLLHKIDFSEGTITLGNSIFSLLDSYFPTIDPDNPYELTAGEQQVVEELKLCFLNSRELQEHVRFLYANGGMYLVWNDNLLYHGCIAMNEDGSFKAFEVDDKKFSGRPFIDRVERLSRQGFFSSDSDQKQIGMDAMWYLWCGAQSPLFGKEKMATFERYFVADRATHAEPRNPYYELRDNQQAIENILSEFGLESDRSRIINGHVPVEVKRGESPIKANGKLVVIDGGFSKAYQNQTGIAGYTLLSNSRELLLIANTSHEPVEKVPHSRTSGIAEVTRLDIRQPPQRVRDTDDGAKIQAKIGMLNQLLEMYRHEESKEIK